jgi:hypothetical protein
MPRKDLFHDALKNALINEGWVITDDPLDLSFGDVDLMADLGAERIIAAEKLADKIAIEIKSFVGQSPVSEFHKALGQYENYLLAIEELKMDRKLYLAVPLTAWIDFFQRPFIQKALQKHQISMLIFEPQTQQIISWIK